MPFPESVDPYTLFGPRWMSHERDLKIRCDDFVTQEHTLSVGLQWRKMVDKKICDMEEAVLWKVYFCSNS